MKNNEIDNIRWKLKLSNLLVQVQSLAELHKLHVVTGAAESVEDSAAYLSRKQQDLLRTQEAALASAADHAAILCWGVA